MIEPREDPYDKPENAYRTDGVDACHWCWEGAQAWLWEPYQTRVCDDCQQRLQDDPETAAWSIVEEVAARLTVRDRWHKVDPESWRLHEHGLIRRWLELRTTCRRI